MILNDKNIRHFLIEKLKTRRIFFLKEELRLIDNRAIADIVTLGKTIHCYEIKGETDSLSRLENQVSLYDKTFDKITIVIAQSFQKQIEKSIPNHWGIILVFKTENGIKFKYLRKACINKNCEKYNILLSMWKTELLEILGLDKIKNLNKYNRDELIQLVKRKFQKKTDINIEFSKQIAKRKAEWIT